MHGVCQARRWRRTLEAGCCLFSSQPSECSGRTAGRVTSVSNSKPPSDLERVDIDLDTLAEDGRSSVTIGSRCNCRSWSILVLKLPPQCLARLIPLARPRAALATPARAPPHHPHRLPHHHRHEIRRTRSDAAAPAPQTSGESRRQVTCRALARTSPTAPPRLAAAPSLRTITSAPPIPKPILDSGSTPAVRKWGR